MKTENFIVFCTIYQYSLPLQNFCNLSNSTTIYIAGRFSSFVWFSCLHAETFRHRLLLSSRLWHQELKWQMEIKPLFNITFPQTTSVPLKHTYINKFEEILLGEVFVQGLSK